jgi:hypothetical protein
MEPRGSTPRPHVNEGQDVEVLAHQLTASLPTSPTTNEASDQSPS